MFQTNLKVIQKRKKLLFNYLILNKNAAISKSKNNFFLEIIETSLLIESIFESIDVFLLFFLKNNKWTD